MSVEDFCWLTVPLHGPVVDRGLRHQGDHVLRDPLPEDDVVRHRVRLHLGLHLNVEDLQRLLGLEGDHLTGRVHDGGVGADGTPDGVGGVGHVDDDHLGRLPHLLPHADELVALHGEGVEADVGGIDSDICELKNKEFISYYITKDTQALGAGGWMTHGQNFLPSKKIITNICFPVMH